MDSKLKNQYKPDYAVLPGDVLEYELELRDMTQQELAKRTGLTPKHIVSVIKGRASITPETAIKFERAIGMPADYWLNLESQYQEIMARLDEEKSLTKDLGWLKKIPVNEMSKLGWIKKVTDKKSQLVEVLRFFGIAKVEQWEKMWSSLSVAYRQHSSASVDVEAVSAWLRRGEIEANTIECESFDKVKFRKALDEIKKLTAEPPHVFIPQVKKLCSESGVAVIFLPSLPKTGVSGSARWLTPSKALIQLSLRYKTDDHLWFTFYHEAGHILLHGKKDLFLEWNNGLDMTKEKEANDFAEHELIPKKEMTSFIECGIFSSKSILDFACRLGISAGIVVGQLQHKKIISNSYLNNLKIKFEWQQGDAK